MEPHSDNLRIDPQQHMIIIGGKDRTADIAEFMPDQTGYLIRFKNSPKEFRYSSNKVTVLTVQGVVDQAAVKLHHEGKPIGSFEQVLDFDDRIRVFGKKGFMRSYLKSSLRFERNELRHPPAQRCMAYLRRIAEHVSLTSEDGSLILSDKYESIQLVGEDTVLANYINPNKAQNCYENTGSLIYPFGINLSQKKAVASAFSSQVSIIEGPPGTGKTQTILNIIANAVMQEKTIAVASFNNSATANVQEKLEKYGLSFISAFLGNAKTKEQFIENQTGCYPDMSAWQLTLEQKRQLTDSAAALSKELDEMMSAQNRIAAIEQEAADLICEQRHFSDYAKDNAAHHEIMLRASTSSRQLLTVLLRYEQAAERSGFIDLLVKIMSVLFYHIGSFKLYKQPSNVVMAALMELFYQIRLRELENEKSKLEKLLEHFRFDEKLEELTQKSMQLFKGALAERYFSQNGERVIFRDNDLWQKPDIVNREYPLILSTTYSIRGSLSRDHVYDMVVIDESSQADIVTGALALSCARNALIVGDLMQLPNVVTERIKKITDMIWSESNIDEAY